MKKLREFKNLPILSIGIVFFLIGIILFRERSGVNTNLDDTENSPYLADEFLMTKDEVIENIDIVSLVIYNSTDDTSNLAITQFRQILKDMKVGYRELDISEEPLVEYDDYETVIVLMADLSPFGEDIIRLTDWVYDGGQAMFAVTLAKNEYSTLIEQKLGIVDDSYANAMVSDMYISDFMVGGGQSYEISDPFESAWTVRVSERATVYAWTNDDKEVPLIWECPYGEGKFAVDNFGIYVKSDRGLYAATYSLLNDVSIYPVINASTFYLDDFPSPVPAGDGSYIRRDYGINISEFYTNVWWTDLMNIAEQFGLKFTGVIIENYDDKTDGIVVETKDTQRFQYFGNMLLHIGGELGYHGYNHQPYSLSNVDYGDELPYNTWVSEEAMENAMTELIRFSEDQFPRASMTVYVPPSNVLSEEGRRMLGDKYPEIKSIASNFFSGDFSYEQEFDIAEDGIVEQPRTISGCLIDSYDVFTALSELNMHYVNNHFMHPDDLLDEDRGAELGWEELKTRLTNYISWLYTSAPNIRSLTGSQMAGAVERFTLAVPNMKVTEDMVRISIDNFHDEAYFFVRFNEGKPSNVYGGEIEEIASELYLLHATSEEVVIERA